MKGAAIFFAFHIEAAAGAAAVGSGTCKDVKDFYREKTCCGNPSKATGHQVIPAPNSGTSWGSGSSGTTNKCHGAKPHLPNAPCLNETDNTVAALEQAGANVTKGSNGTLATSVVPILEPYYTQGLCPVNVHWHLGAEHLSAGEYDETFKSKGPTESASPEQRGFRCGKYDANNKIFTTPYKWRYCSKMAVGETYEVHWPHSKLGACGTTAQYQTPFYDGVFCRFQEMLNSTLPPPQGRAHAIGVQAQIFTVVNDEKYYYPDLMRGMIVDGKHGQEVTKYTGSTTGSKRNNTVCSSYAPITWQVDRKCHLISASSFDKMCADMLAQKDDMSGDTHPHGSRELVAAKLSAQNRQHRRLSDSEFVVDAMVY